MLIVAGQHPQHRFPLRAPCPAACRLQGISDADVGTLQGVLEDAVQVSAGSSLQCCSTTFLQQTPFGAQAADCSAMILPLARWTSFEYSTSGAAGEPGDGHGVYAHHHGAGVGAGAARGCWCSWLLGTHLCAATSPSVEMGHNGLSGCWRRIILPSQPLTVWPCLLCTPVPPHRTSRPRWRCPRRTQRPRSGGGGMRRRRGWRRCVRTATPSRPRPLLRCGATY